MEEIKITKFDLLWNYLGYGIAFLSNIIILPIILNYFDEKELGLWYVFLSINSFVVLLDFGFTPQISRQISYILSGSRSIEKKGYTGKKDEKSNVDYDLLHKTLKTAKYIYLGLALSAVFVLTILWFVYIQHISNGIEYAGISWFIFSLGCFINLYYYYYSGVFKGFGDFVSLNKALIISKITYIVVAAILVLNGFSLLGITSAFLFGNVAFRIILTFSHNKKFKKHSAKKYRWIDFKNLFSKLFYNSSRDGLVMISRFAVVQGNIMICSIYLGLKVTASFGLSLQILSVFSQIALLSYSTVMPKINQLRISKNNQKIIELFSASWVVFVVLYFSAVLLFILIGPHILDLISSNTKIDFWTFTILSIYIFLESNHSLFASLISTSNRLPYVKSFVVSSVLGLSLALFLMEFTQLGIIALILSHLLIQAAYNNWKWISYNLKEFKIDFISLFKQGITTSMHHLQHILKKK